MKKKIQFRKSDGTKWYEIVDKVAVCDRRILQVDAILSTVANNVNILTLL